jgi:hypothetical protein
MIYASEERAIEVAAELNKRKGHCPTQAVLTPEGWSIVCGWDQATRDKWDIRKNGTTRRDLIEQASALRDQLRFLYNTKSTTAARNAATIAEIDALETRALWIETTALIMEDAQ